MTDAEFMFFLALLVLLLVGSPILWMFAKQALIKMGWIAKLSKLDKLVLNNDLRGFWESELASRCVTGTFFVTALGALLFIGALYSSVDLTQPAVLISGMIGIFHLGTTIRQLSLGWDRASQSGFVKQLAHSMEMRRESLIYRFGEEIVK